MVAWLGGEALPGRYLCRGTGEAHPVGVSGIRSTLNRLFKKLFDR
jgi:hypothetical protein